MSQLSEIIEKIGNIKAMTFWKDKNCILASTEKAIMMWDVLSLQMMNIIKVNTDIKTLRMVPDSSILFAGGKSSQGSGGLLIFDLRNTSNPLQAQREKTIDIFSLAATKENVFFGCRDHYVKSLNLNSLNIDPLKVPHFDAVTSLALLRNSNGQFKTLVSGSRDKNLRCVDLANQDFISQDPDETITNAHHDHVNVLETDLAQ